MPLTLKASPMEILESSLELELFNEEKSLLAPSNTIWTELRRKLDNRLSQKHLWLIFHVDRYKLNSKYRLAKGMVSDSLNKTKDSTMALIQSDTSEISTETSVDWFDDDLEMKKSEKKINELPLINSILILNNEEWFKIKPISVRWYDKRNGERAYYTLQSGWTDVLYEAIWSQLRLPCGYSFKRHLISERNTNPWIKIRGICNECGAVFKAHIVNKPKEDSEGITFQISATDTRGVAHNKKRQLTGVYRKRIGRELSSKKAANWRRREATKIMKFGEPEPSHLFSKEVLRKAKQEIRDDDLIGGKFLDIVTSLCNLQNDVEYSGIIKEFCINKFHLIYWTEYQLYVYKKMTKENGAMFCIDATGSLVKKLKRSEGIFSGNIFLYQGVISADGKILPVIQMLSEKHHTNMLTYWLREWVRNRVPIPNEVVTDFSLSLMHATSMAFNTISLDTYNDTCLYALQKRAALPTTYLRIDIAHLIKMVCRWKCFEKNTRSAIKDFYVRCVGLLATTSHLDEFRNILLSVLIVSQSQTDGTKEETNDDTECEKCQKFLINSIKTFNLPNYEFIESENDRSDDEESNNTGGISNFIKAINDQVDLHCSQKGLRLNAYFLPAFVHDLLRICKYFPMWTGVMASLYGKSVTATSCYVENYFKELKTSIMENENLPIRIDKFLILHIRSILGTMTLFQSSKLPSVMDLEKSIDTPTDILRDFDRDGIQFVDSKFDVVIPKIVTHIDNPKNKISEQLNYLENWRGLSCLKKKENIYNPIRRYGK